MTGELSSGLDDHGLGRLGTLDVREVWTNEAHDFTPWLVQNLDVLTDTLSIDGIVSVEREVPVGGFSLDILGEDVSGRKIAIENQLDVSDHSHLGQMMVYAAGLQAEVVVWVAPRFRDEHRAVVDWLNEHTDPGVDFFAVEVRVVRIGESPPAPVFDVIAQPNDWGKATKHRGQASDLAQQRQLFFQDALERLARRVPGFRIPKAPLQNWVSFRSGPFGTFAMVFAAHGRFRVEVYLDSTDETLPKTLFDALFAEREAIQSAVGDELTWERIDERRASRIAIYRQTPELNDPDAVDECAEWAAECASHLINTFDERLRGMIRQLQSR